MTPSTPPVFRPMARPGAANRSAPRRRRATRILLVGLLAAFAGVGCRGTRGPDGSPAGHADQPAPAEVPRFAFHIDFGMNLHHFLYWTANPHGRGAAEGVPLAWPEDLTAGERATVDAALAYYRDELADQDLLFGQRAYAIKLALLERGENAGFGGLELEAEHARHLEAAAPIYRRHLWPDHQASAARFVATLTDRLERDGERMRQRVEGALRDPMPPAPIRVDLVPEGHWAGAYTTIEPTHIVIVPGRPAHRGHAGLEILFHEAGHGMIGSARGATMTALREAMRGTGGSVPEGFWHALLFDTVGWAAEQVAAETGAGPYERYATAHGLWRGAWATYKRALDRHWRPYLEGETSFPEAIAGLADALAAEAD